MDFLNSLTAWQWAILLAIPPAIVLLYFLKLRRQPVEVPSTYLWHKAIEDLHVNSLWQRIRKNLLLYLQLLLVGLVILALLRPGWRSQQLTGGRYVILIDNSASMNATDVRPSRLDEAKNLALALIDKMASGDQAMVISFSDTARVEQGLTDRRRELRQAVENIRPTHHTTLLDDALRAAAGLAKTGGATDASESEESNSPPAKMFIFSDGKFPPVQGFSLGSLEPVFVPIGQAKAENLGIVAFGVRAEEDRPEQVKAFGSIENFGETDTTALVELLLDGQLIDASQVKVPAGETAGVAFDLGERDSGVLELRLPRSDALADDNQAWAILGGNRLPKVLLVTPGNYALELALATPRASELADVSLAGPDILKTDEYRKDAAGGAYDLIIYDRCRPEQPPLANTLYIGELPPEPATVVASADDSKLPQQARWSRGEPVILPQIIDFARTHPMLEWLDLSDIDIAEARPVEPPTGGTRLIESGRGTLLAIAPRDGYEDAVLGFEIYTTNAEGQTFANTNWVRRSFPAFVFGVLEYLGGRTQVASHESVRPGQAVPIKTHSQSEHLTVERPDGDKLRVSPAAGGVVRFNQTSELGPYAVLDGGNVVERFAVNLFDPPESNIRPAPENSVQIGHVTVEGQTAYEPARQEIWKWLVLAALVVLVLEWYIYNRRVYV